MTPGLVLFDRIRDRVADVLASCPSLATLDRLYVVRDLRGRVRICVSDSMETDESRAQVLQDLARRLHEALGAHGYPAHDTVVFLDSAMLQSLDDAARELQPGVFWVDRLVTGRDWWSVGSPCRKTGADRYTLFSVKGGVGRSTSAVMLAWRLARNGERVLVVDLDLESPGLSSAMLDSGSQPEFGIADWFVEDLVDQGSSLVERMTAVPTWAHDLEGDVHVAPTHGREPGEYLAKLGRVHMDTGDPWTQRLERLLSQLEERCDPSIVLLESRSGLHDIAATTVTDLDAQVLLFAVDSESHWTDYRILFRHWQTHGLARAIRERLSIVSALTPELDPEPYLRRFQERAWDLFREHLYDDVAPSDEAGDAFSFDALEEDAPHAPIVIHWTRGLAAGASLLAPERTPAGQAYAQFFARFDGLIAANRAERSSRDRD